MSEEKLINKIKEIIEVDKNAKIISSIYEEVFLRDYLQGLLDLYNKEKEKNEILEDTLNNSIDIRKYWISKDKIREKIKELNDEFDERNSREEDFNYNYGDEYAFVVEKLKELLEEE